MSDQLSAEQRLGRGLSNDRAGQPGVPEGLGRELEICEQLVANGDPGIARQRILAWDVFTPENEQQWKRLHAICLQLEERTRGQSFTEKFLAANTDNAAAHLANARYFLPNYNNRHRVRASLDVVLRHPEPTAEYWRHVAEIQFAIQDHEGVRHSVPQALAFDPAGANLREMMISSLGTLSRFREVRRECALLAKCLVQSGETNPLRWARLARIAAETGAIRQARAYIDISTGHFLGVDYTADFELARALMLTRQPGRATKHVESLLKENRPNVWMWNTLVETAMMRRYYDVALLAIRRLKAIPHQDPEFLYRLDLSERAAAKKRTGVLSGVTLVQSPGKHWLRRLLALFGR